jgi:hypothetical protein
MPKLILVIFITSLYTFCGKAQEEGATKNMLEIRHDNDFVLSTDRYYSAGLYFTFHRTIEEGLFNDGDEQWSLLLSQLTFTPSDIETFTVENLDRPYAGFLGLKTGWSLAKQDIFYNTFLEIGLTGPNSGAGKFQQWYHDNIVRYKTPTWFSEIGTKLHFNLEGTLVKEWQVNPNPFSITFALQPTIALGTKDRYLQQEAIVYFGRKNETSKSIAYNQLNSLEREIYFSLSTGYRYVGYNDLLQGVLTQNSPALNRDIERWVLRLNFDFHHRSGKNNYKFGYRYNSNETRLSNNHKYLILSYGRSF